MPELDTHFHRELASFEQSLLDIGDKVERMIGLAVRAVTAPDPALAESVIAEDGVVDRLYLEAHDRWVNLMARQQPVASDLRLLAALLSLNITLERCGDQCVNIAKMTTLTEGLPRSERIVSMITEMGDLVQPMIRTAFEALIRRDAEEARLLPAMDDPVDRLNRRMYREVVACGPDEALLEWATRMLMVSRALERIGDQAVDIGEQVVFVVTGAFQEFEEDGKDL